MNKTKILMIGTFIILTAACGNVETGGEKLAEVEDTSSLIAALQAEDVGAVAKNGSVDQPFFSVRGDIIEIGNNSIQVFEYPTDADRTADSDLISPDGTSIGTTMVSWIEPPHFWVKGKLIVLYIGNDSAFIDLLSQVIGLPITE